MDLLGTAVTAGVGGIVAALIVGIQSFFKARFRNKTDRLEETTRHLVKMQTPILDGVQTLLEVSKGNCNGNVENALAVMKGAKAEHLEFLAERSV